MVLGWRNFILAPPLDRLYVGPLRRTLVVSLVGVGVCPSQLHLALPDVAPSHPWSSLTATLYLPSRQQRRKTRYLDCLRRYLANYGIQRYVTGE